MKLKAPQQLTSYIANLNQVRDHHRDIVEDLTERGFPAVISNDLMVPETREYPFASAGVARENLTLKIITLRDPSLAFFFLFMEDSQRNEIAAFELGLAIQTKAKIVLIGSHGRSPQHFLKTDGDKIISAYDYENFAAQRYLVP